MKIITHPFMQHTGRLWPQYTNQLAQICFSCVCLFCHLIVKENHIVVPECLHSVNIYHINKSPKILTNACRDVFVLFTLSLYADVYI